MKRSFVHPCYSFVDLLGPRLVVQVPISEGRAWVILQNYRMKGAVHYFVAVLKKNSKGSCLRFHKHTCAVQISITAAISQVELPDDPWAPPAMRDRSTERSGVSKLSGGENHGK